MLLATALTHRSFRNERGGGAGHNERLELLGDAVVGLLVTHMLMRAAPAASEGSLSLLRSQVVSEGSLAERARELGLGEWLRLGKGEGQSGGADKPSLLSDAFEAVFGALFLDGGLIACQAAAERLLRGAIERVCAEGGSDQKSALQDLLQKLHQARPRYEILSTSGPEHEKEFVVAVYLADRLLAQGIGRSKRSAEQSAAGAALDVLDAELD